MEFYTKVYTSILENGSNLQFKVSDIDYLRIEVSSLDETSSEHFITLIESCKNNWVSTDDYNIWSICSYIESIPQPPIDHEDDEISTIIKLDLDFWEFYEKGGLNTKIDNVLDLLRIKNENRIKKPITQNDIMIAEKLGKKENIHSFIGFLKIKEEIKFSDDIEERHIDAYKTKKGYKKGSLSDFVEFINNILDDNSVISENMQKEDIKIMEALNLTTQNLENIITFRQKYDISDKDMSVTKIRVFQKTFMDTYITYTKKRDDMKMNNIQKFCIFISQTKENDLPDEVFSEDNIRSYSILVGTHRNKVERFCDFFTLLKNYKPTEEEIWLCVEIINNNIDINKALLTKKSEDSRLDYLENQSGEEWKKIIKTYIEDVISWIAEDLGEYKASLESTGKATNGLSTYYNNQKNFIRKLDFVKDFKSNSTEVDVVRRNIKGKFEEQYKEYDRWDTKSRYQKTINIIKESKTSLQNSEKWFFYKNNNGKNWERKDNQYRDAYHSKRKSIDARYQQEKQKYYEAHKKKWRGIPALEIFMKNREKLSELKSSGTLKNNESLIQYRDENIQSMWDFVNLNIK